MDPAFKKLLEEAKMSFNEPTENRYKTIRSSKNPVFKDNFSIKVKKGDLEIRYAISKPDDNNDKLIFPHIASMTTASHIASNANDSEIVVQNLKEGDLINQLKADWASIFYFNPKAQFSTKKFCKMLAMYKDGIGLVYVFFLFNKPSIELDNQFYTLSFLTDTTKRENQ